MVLTSVLCSYNPKWASQYRDEQRLLSKLFGTDIKAIHHIGSTSVVGLVAKPEIDILIIIDPQESLSKFVTKLETLNYEFRGEGPGKYGHWFFRKNKNGVRTHKIHLCFEGHVCIEEQLIFRNYLIDNPSVAGIYGELKLKLERKNKGGILEYLNKKSPFIKSTLSMAKKKGYSI